MPVESPSASPAVVAPLDIITRAHSNRHARSGPSRARRRQHTMIGWKSLFKEPIWKRQEDKHDWGEPGGFACLIFIAPCLLNSSFGQPLKETGSPIDCGDSLGDYRCRYRAALIARRHTHSLPPLFACSHGGSAASATRDKTPWPTALQSAGAIIAAGIFFR